MGRPRHTKRDANHGDVVAGSRAGGLRTYDTADAPGGLDFIATDGRLMIWVEVKPDDKAPFTEAEARILADNPHTTMVAYCAEDVLKRFERLG